MKSFWLDEFSKNILRICSLELAIISTRIGYSVTVFYLKIGGFPMKNQFMKNVLNLYLQFMVSLQFLSYGTLGPLVSSRLRKNKINTINWMHTFFASHGNFPWKMILVVGIRKIDLNYIYVYGSWFISPTVTYLWLSLLDRLSNFCQVSSYTPIQERLN